MTCVGQSLVMDICLVQVADALKTLKAEGKVLYFGVSNFTPSQIQLLQSRLPFALVTNQIETNVLHLDPLHDGTLDHAQVSFFKQLAR